MPAAGQELCKISSNQQSFRETAFNSVILIQGSAAALSRGDLLFMSLNVFGKTSAGVQVCHAAHLLTPGYAAAESNVAQFWWLTFPWLWMVFFSADKGHEVSASNVFQSRVFALLESQGDCRDVTHPARACGCNPHTHFCSSKTALQLAHALDLLLLVGEGHVSRRVAPFRILIFPFDASSALAEPCPDFCCVLMMAADQTPKR